MYSCNFVIVSRCEKVFSNFCYLVMISPWKKSLLVLERMIFKFVNVFSLFRNYLPFEKDGTLHLNQLDFKNDFCDVWLKLSQWFWRRRFFNFVNVFSLIRNYLPLEKGGALHLNKLESPLPKNALCEVWLKLDHWFWRRR